MRHQRTPPQYHPDSDRAARALAALELVATVDRWNAAHPIGSRVAYRSHPAAIPLETVTTAPAFVLSEHTPVAIVADVRGVVALSALELIA